MDERRPNTFQMMQRKKVAQPVASATSGTMLMAAFMGLFFLVSFSVGKDYVSHLTIYFSLYIVLLSSMLISDFTSVLIDVRDNYIILPKPVNDRTIVLARLLHIIIHLAKLVVPMTLPGIVYMIIKTSVWGALVFIVLLGLSTLLTIFMINASYLLILRLTTPARFQSVISYFQIFITIFIYGGYQLGLRAMDNAAMQGYDFSALPYIWIAPSFWFAECWQGLFALQIQPGYIAGAIMSFVTPFISIWIVIKYFAPSFNQRLAQISGANPAPSIRRKGKNISASGHGYAGLLARIFTSDGPEKMGFLFCWKMSGRSKDFKIKVYPGIGYFLVYLVIMFVTSKKVTIHSLLHDTVQGKRAVLSVLYFCSLVLIMAISQIPYSEKFKAAWIYFTTPVQSPGKLLTGALKALLFKFYLPVIVLITIPAIYIMGPAAIPNLLLGFCNQLLICSLITYISPKYLPFSANQSVAEKSGSFLRTVYTLVIPSVIGIVHYFLADFTVVICIAILLAALAAWLVTVAITKTGWPEVKSTYE
jgi:ABC-2 type transport system permease protein